MLNILCMVAVVVILTIIDSKPLKSWRSVIQPNTVRIVLATTAKSALQLPVAELISQLKWLYYREPDDLLIMLGHFHTAR